MNCSTLGIPVHHLLPEFTQTQGHRVGDAIQPSHPLSSSSPPAPRRRRERFLVRRGRPARLSRVSPDGCARRLLLPWAHTRRAPAVRRRRRRVLVEEGPGAHVTTVPFSAPPSPAASPGDRLAVVPRRRFQGVVGGEASAVPLGGRIGRPRGFRAAATGPRRASRPWSPRSSPSWEVIQIGRAHV